MTDREMLIEVLAIKIYEHDSQSGERPSTYPTWRARGESVRQTYRDIVAAAATPEDLYK
jgi:hypothetical protein